jgi:hypothetical protein
MRFFARKNMYGLSNSLTMPREKTLPRLNSRMEQFDDLTGFRVDPRQVAPFA